MWLDLVQADLEKSNYACGAVDFCAAGAGAPIRRQRIWFVAQALECTSSVGREWGQKTPSEHDNVRQAPSGTQNQHGAGVSSTHWDQAEWIVDRDGCARPVEPGTFPLAHGASARVGRLRAYGNAIVPQVAAEFISAYLGAKGEL
jgi:DNA (cytosine-5)-methyltransferase 1